MTTPQPQVDWNTAQPIQPRVDWSTATPGQRQYIYPVYATGSA
jgi:hypothetical protein